MTAAAAAVVILLLPLVTLRGRTLLTCWGTQLAAAALAFLLQRHIALDARLGFITLAVVEVAIVLLFIARGAQVRWSANRAAVMAAMLYGISIPAMMLTPIDGDEPFYLLVTESIVLDFDLDLANQYRTLAESAGGRTDLEPQLGDPVGSRGELYSRHEPFLPLVMVPGYLAGGLTGAIATIALFGVLLVRSTFRWFDEEEVDAATQRAIFGFFALAPPILFYATRIWPEVPAAFCFVEAIRGFRDRRTQRWAPALLGMVLLKLRFGLVAIMFALKQGKKALVIIPIVLVPLLILKLATGSATSVHSWRELLPGEPVRYAVGFFGLLLDGMSGIAFQAPFYLLGIFAITRWKQMPEGFRLGCIAATLYIVTLLPRAEWHGGWAPPLRYIVVFLPVLALGAAKLWSRVPRGVVAVIAVWSGGLVIHGLTYPWRLFHIANGENALGEWLSTLYSADVSRLFPSYIRLNDAAFVGGVVLVIAFVAFRFVKVPSQLAIAALSLAIAVGIAQAKRPGKTIQFEDAHVQHEGGELHPHVWMVQRFLQRGGWMARDGNALTFLAREGDHVLHYGTGTPALIEVAGHAYELPPTGPYTRPYRVHVDREGKTTIRVLHGQIFFERMTHE
ncbi:MAG TPA: hypothetical protein VGF69_15015 [Thermoanaerobaculia bacterium]|jgi:hypothetical protein